MPGMMLDAEEKMKTPEDIKFLQSMKTDRIASFGGFDASLAKQKQRSEQRKLLDRRRQEKAEAEMAELTATATFESCSDTDPSDTEDGVDLLPGTSMDTHPRRKHRRVVHSGTEAFIPHNIMKSPKMVALATRMKMTPSQQAAFTEAFVQEAGGDVSKVYTSYAVADKSRREIGKQIAESYQEKWDVPQFASLHWDGKLLPSLTNKYENEERLTVAVGDVTDNKVLGVPAYKPGTDKKCGEIISKLTFDLLCSWNCTDSICNMVFDTTTSNTGHVSAACIQIQETLERPLLWSGCRHHVGEVILTHVFEDLKIETSKSPDVMLFTRLRKNWNLVPHESDQPLHRIQLASFPEEGKDLIDEWRAETLQLVTSQVDQKRDDYKEFLQLCAVYLDPDYPTTTFQRPGALHKARWMAKLIYCLKICLFETQIQDLPSGTITAKHQGKKLTEFVTFATLVYSTWWMQCSISVDAPWNDLLLYKKLLRYQELNTIVASSALKAFSRHLWYLTGELIPLALFSSNTPAHECRLLADQLLQKRPDTPRQLPQNRFGTGFGKPRFPTEVNLGSKLADFVTEDSWFFFHVLKLEAGFLSLDVSEWPESEFYKNALINVGAINVVNDSAERGVKLSSDFLAAAHGEEHYQNVLQVVEENRKMRPNLRKRTTEPDDKSQGQ